MGLVSTSKSALRGMAKSVIFPVLGSAQLLRRRLDRVRTAKVTTVLNLHRVAPVDGSNHPPLSPALFEDLLAFVTREFSVVTFGELGETSSKPKLVLSFDDGYRDFVTHAVPAMKRHGVRANQNIIPKCVETGLPPLNVLAQDFVGKAPRELVAGLNVPGYSGPRDRSFGAQLSHFLKMRPQTQQDRLAEVLIPQFFAWDGFNPTPMMNADELKCLTEHEIGAHSWAHSSMEFESDNYLDEDVRRCRAWFHDRLRLPMTIYAFPNGSWREGQPERVLQQGVEHVLLVGEGFDRDRRVHQRFTFHAHNVPEARFRAVGGLAPV